MSDYSNECSEGLVITIALVVISFILGVTVKSIPYFEFDKSVSIIEAISLFVTVVIAILIPIFIKHFIENGSKQNDIVLKEINLYRSQLDFGNSKFREIKKNKTITNLDKDELVIICETLDSKLTNLIMMVERRCKKKTLQLITNIKQNHILYWDLLTNDEINKQDVVVISNSQFRKENDLFQNLTKDILELGLVIAEY